ncbi:MAG: glycosyl hydrolase, partial [Candidatus Gracilibacteria bacterium]|nr:glycosyl hydrolase [Candidatus Gracilibacteria bacterium]
MKKFFHTLVLLGIICTSVLEAGAQFAFGVYPELNSTKNQLQIEQKYHFTSPVVGYIFDTFDDNDAAHLRTAVKTLGTDRVYHVSISPFGLTAAEVAQGKYDEEYRRFFKIVKESGAKFLFRTMHEMNGSWFSWSGDPYSFKRAWERVYNLSREAGLDTSNILFIFSVNYQDLPSANGDIGGEMIFCTTGERVASGCKTFEDYYPGDKYVDLMGMTLYNWGRGRPELWAHWTTFADLLGNSSTNMLGRLSSYGKSIFLDEVGTTAVDFKGPWTFDKVINGYTDDFGKKDYWISMMRQEIKRYPQIIGALYFNRDKTRGFTLGRTIPGELDWAALSTVTDKDYPAILRFFTDPDVTL